MNRFEMITASPEALGAFLASIPTADTPWDDCFNRIFCAGCDRDDCDTAPCPHQAERNNPTWWLKQETGDEPQTPRNTIFSQGDDPNSNRKEVKKVMRETLKGRIEKIVEGYIDMVENRLKTASSSGEDARQNGYAMSDAMAGMRYAAETLEIMNRISKNS